MGICHYCQNFGWIFYHLCGTRYLLFCSGVSLKELLVLTCQVTCATQLSMASTMDYILILVLLCGHIWFIARFHLYIIQRYHVLVFAQLLSSVFLITTRSHCWKIRLLMLFRFYKLLCLWCLIQRNSALLVLFLSWCWKGFLKTIRLWMNNANCPHLAFAPSHRNSERFLKKLTNQRGVENK